MRDGGKPKKKVQKMKNRAKGESYKYAFERIKLSLEKEFSLEAICLIESILSDRLLSNAIGGNEGNSKKVVEASFFDLIKLFQAYGEKNDDDEARALGCALDNWRRGRNTL